MRTLTFNRVLGAGAMGTVYHAELRVPGGFRRPCAVKVIQEVGPDHAHFVSRMRDEARLLGMLQDEQVLGVSELVVVGGRDAVIMDYVEGVDLSDLVERSPVPPRALAELGAEVAGTLGRAHAARHPTTGEPLHVIHRDIKPANVMITTRGGVRLLDFGVARAAFSSRESHTQGLVLGTLNYFPPEVLQGGDPTTAVDIYGLGLSLWECATGRDWGAPKVSQASFDKRVRRRMEELGPDFAPLVPILESALAWDPRRRPHGADLERALLAAADALPGASLRSWAREVVPVLLAEREGKQRWVADALVGQTLEVAAQDADAGPLDLELDPTTGSGSWRGGDWPPPDPGVPDPASTFNGDDGRGLDPAERAILQEPTTSRSNPAPAPQAPPPSASPQPNPPSSSPWMPLLLGGLVGLALLFAFVAIGGVAIALLVSLGSF